MRPSILRQEEKARTESSPADVDACTGHALIQAMLHLLGATRNITVPVSAGLLRDTSGYFEALTAYRADDVAPIIRALAGASLACWRPLRMGDSWWPT